MLQIFELSSQDGATTLQIERLPKMPEKAAKSDGRALWLNLEDPDQAELKYITELFALPEDFLSDPLDPAERPRASHSGDATLIIARASYHPDTDEASGGSIAAERAEQNYPTVPIGMIMTGETTITVCRVPGVVSELLTGKIPVGKARRHSCITLKLLEKISTRFIKHLQKLDEISNHIEEGMQKSTRNEELRRMLQLEKTLVYFLNSLKANSLAIEKLLSNQAFSWTEEEKERLIDALIECRQAVEMGEVFTQIIANMGDIYASMISNNMNMVMKFLTAITLILMAPTIVVGLYGMNVPLPLQESPWALPLISIVTVGICWALWRFLLKKHWM